jgi:hypothetical protein
MEKEIVYLDEITVRFAGDSGDGMQLAGTQFSNASASSGVDVNTFPDFPSEIRAPEGTLYGVSAFQIKLGSSAVNTHGDVIDLLSCHECLFTQGEFTQCKKGWNHYCQYPRVRQQKPETCKICIQSVRRWITEGLSGDFPGYGSIIKEELKGSGINPKIIRNPRTFSLLGLPIGYSTDLWSLQLNGSMVNLKTMPMYLRPMFAC